MNKGTLSFAIDGKFYGIAFQDEGLKSGPIYPAVSLLHNAGCTLISNKNPPSCFFD
jgi:E3 ubiquitin-protein ligase NRDP1